MYYYTTLKQNGVYYTTESAKKWEYQQLRNAIGGYIEIIPKAFYPKGMTGTVYGHEEARFNVDNHTNPHLLVVTDIFGDKHDTVGDLLLEQTQKQYDKWQATLEKEEA